MSEAVRATEIDPGKGDWHAITGWAAYKCEDWKDSLAASHRALELNGRLPGAAFNIGLVSLASGDTGQAR